MAYITSDEVKEIRNKIKAAFPAKDGWKWSVTKDHHSSVVAALMAYPEGYDFPEYEQVNHFHFERSEHFGKKETAVLKKVNEILHENHWDESDTMTDYFNCAYYVNLHIGKWDRPAVAVAPKVKKARVSKPRKAVASTQAKPAMVTAGYGLSDSECRDIAAFVGIQF